MSGETLTPIPKARNSNCALSIAIAKPLSCSWASVWNAVARQMLDNAQVAHDIQNPQQPQTAFGYAAEGIRRRKAAGNGPITILSCDNLQHNGNTLGSSHWLASLSSFGMD